MELGRLQGGSTFLLIFNIEGGVNTYWRIVINSVTNPNSTKLLNIFYFINNYLNKYIYIYIIYQRFRDKYVMLDIIIKFIKNN